MPAMLALPPLGDWKDEGPVVFSGIAPFRQKLVQNAGRSFFNRYEYSGSGDDDDAADDDDESEEDQTTAENGQKKKKPAKERDHALKLSDLLKGVDLYALMESDDSASQEDLKKSYRKLCLTHHPDKQTQPLNDKAKEEMNQRFLKLQEAYEVLSDAKKRRKYDSMGTFDDSVPSNLKKGQDFFVVFREVFQRNAKWSERKPVPDLGDAAMPFEKVDKFYDFWRGFQSWRELDEQIMEEEGEDCFMKLEDAECREERRWMERANGKLREKARKVERERVMRLVGNAESLDPRVLAEKERKRLVREAEKAEKDAKRAEIDRVAREEEERKAAVERELEDARKAEKAKKDEDRQAKKVARAALRKQINNMNLSIYDEQLQEFLLALEPTEMEVLSKALSKKKPNGQVVLQAMRDKGMDPIIRKVAPEERSTTEGSDSGAEEEDPAKKAEAAKLEKERRKEQIRKSEEKDVELTRIREEEAIKEAENKKVRDAKKKVDNEKKDQERKKAEKKATDGAKKAEEKKRKNLEQADAKAAADKLANQMQAEEQKARALQDKEDAELERELEEWQMEFERDRLGRLEALEKMEWPDVIELSREACASPAVAGALSAARGRQGEDLLDAQLSCLGSVFVVGVRPDQEAPGVSSSLRNRMKKLRAKLRFSAEAGEFWVEPAAGVKKNAAALERLLRIGVGLDMEVAVAQVTKPDVVEEVEVASEPVVGKKKGKAKAAPKDEEDLDALLAEFGCDTSAKKPKKKSKK